MTEAARRFTLRDLPIPAKLVLTCFLLAVGGGYTAAMVQLHMQDSKSGEMLPSEADVVLKYTGKKWFPDDTNLPRPVSRFVKLITAPEDAPFGGNGTMSPAFTRKDDGEFNRVDRLGANQAGRLLPERHGERDVLVLWAQSEPAARAEAYNKDHFAIAEKYKQPKSITPRFKSSDDSYRVKSIIETRCVRCHKPNGDDPKAGNYPLQSYGDIERYLNIPAAAPFRAGGDWVKVQEPIGMEKLTQSTHAHLLSFAVLFALTGLVFAFTSYYTWLRCLLGPWVLVTVVADVALWWLARLSEQWGPYFAYAIIGTGAASGVGLGLQITLSLLNMYGWKGKFVVLALYALTAVGAWQLYVHKLKPGMESRRASQAAANKDGTPKVNNPNGNGAGPVVPLNTGGRVGRMLTLAPGVDVLKIQWKAGEPGGMARAFFDKDSAEFAAAVKEKDEATQRKLMPERHGEREALLAWVKLTDSDRRRAFEADAFPLPSDWANKPITADYVKDGKLKVKSLITDRCIRCHDGDDKTPFNDYQSLSEYLK
jgi:cytochrome c553